MNLYSPLKIGNVKIPNRLFLAPMVDVTDLAYRELCRKYGAGMTYTEMLYIDAILHENERTKKIMKTSKKDRPIGLQITGNNVNEFRELVKRDEVRDYDLIDINCGCPSIKITGNEAGSFLLKNPSKIGSMIKILKDEGLTVSAKIRLGFKKNNVMKVAKEIEKAGADALTLHARLATQGRSVAADWKWIKEVKNNIGIPIMGNGDIFSGEDCERMFDETGCDAVMIARGAIGNPFVFREIKRYFEKGKEKEISKKERLKAFGDYLKLAKKYDVVDMSRVKYLGGSFLREFKGAPRARDKFMKMKSFDEIEEFVSNF